MNALLEMRQSELAELCRRHGVERLDVFGSAIRSDFAASSDLDFVVRFSRPGERGYADRYLDLAEALEKLFGRSVDLLTERALRNRILAKSIAATRQTIYGG